MVALPSREWHKGCCSFYSKPSQNKKNLRVWAIKKKAQDEQLINQTEADLKELQNKDGGGFLMQEDKEKLYSLEASRNKILKERKEVLRLKSRAIWMECGDDNT